MEKKKRPKITKGETHRVTTGCGNLYVTPSWDDDGNLIEVFAVLGRAGSCAKCQLEALTRAISLGLKYGIPVSEYINELRGIICPKTGWDEGVHILSCPDAVAKILEKTKGGSDAGRDNSTDKIS